jgi:hypothetical protein
MSEETKIEEEKMRLTPKLSLQIRKRIITGMLNIEIQDELDILPSTWDSWYYRNTQGFRENLIRWKGERYLKKAEKLSGEIMDMPHVIRDEVNTKILSIKQKEAEFLRETLGKDEGYTKRNELTGKDGEPLNPDKEAKKQADSAVDEFLNIENGDSEPKSEGSEDQGDPERDRPDGEEGAVSV